MEVNNPIVRHSNEFREVKHKFFESSKECDNSYMKYGTRIIDDYLEGYLDAGRHSADNLIRRVKGVKKEIGQFRSRQIDMTLDIASMSLNLELVAHSIGISALNDIFTAMRSEPPKPGEDPLELLNRSFKSLENAALVADEDSENIKVKSVELLSLATSVTLGASKVLDLRSIHLSSFAGEHLNKIRRFRECALTETNKEILTQKEHVLNSSIIRGLEELFDIVLDELPVGSIIRLYKRAKNIMTARAVDFSKSDVEKVDLLLDLFELEHVAFVEFERTLGVTNQIIKESL